MSQPEHPLPEGPADFSKRYYDQYVVDMSNDPRAFVPRTLQRVSAVLDLCGPARGRLLCVGAGSLVEPLTFKKAGFDVTAIDVASSLAEKARRAGIETHVVNLDTDPVPGQYNVACCLEVLEHLMDPLGALKKIASAVSAGGKLFVSLPDEFHLASRLRILAGRPYFSHYNWHHLRFFNLRSARELFDAAGLEVVRTRHMPLISPRRKRLQGIGRLLANSAPSLFALSHVFELKPTGDRDS